MEVWEACDRSCCSASSPVCWERPLWCEAPRQKVDVRTYDPRTWPWCRLQPHVCQETDENIFFLLWTDSKALTCVNTFSAIQNFFIYFLGQSLSSQQFHWKQIKDIMKMSRTFFFLVGPQCSDKSFKKYIYNFLWFQPIPWISWLWFSGSQFFSSSLVDLVDRSIS